MRKSINAANNSSNSVDAHLDSTKDWCRDPTLLQLRMIQTRRTDGTTIVGSESDIKVGLFANDMANRDTSLVTFTDTITDSFSVTGIQLGLYN